MRSGQSQGIAVDMRHAVVECRSERYLRVDDKPPPPAWDAIAGIYKTRDARFVRLHTNFPHHRDAVCKVLNCKAERDDVQAALMQWDAEAFETAAYAAGGVVAMMRSRDEWLALPHAKALAELPLVSIEKIGEAAPKPWPGGDRPLAGAARARSVAGDRRARRGPYAGGARRRCPADLRPRSAGDTLAHHRYRPRQTNKFCRTQERAGAGDLARPAGERGYLLARLSPSRAGGARFSLQDAAKLNPGIVYVIAVGLWPCRAMGGSPRLQLAGADRDRINHAEGQAAGVEGPKELPAQMLDHATGYLMAFGAMMARARQAREGGSWHVRVSLARTGQWLVESRPRRRRFQHRGFEGEAVKPFVEEVSSGFGPLRSVSHSAVLSKTPALWARPAMPLGSYPPRWPARIQA